MSTKQDLSKPQAAIQVVGENYLIPVWIYSFYIESKSMREAPSAFLLHFDEKKEAFTKKQARLRSISRKHGGR